MRSGHAGTNPEIEEGRGIHIEWELVQRVVVCAYISEQCSRGVWGHAPSGKFRPYESTSEAIGDHYNHATFMATGASVTQAIRYGCFSEPLPS